MENNGGNKIDKKYIEEKQNEIHEGLSSGLYSHRQKTLGKDGKVLKALCWETLHEILDVTNQDAIIEHFLYCIDCKKVIHNPYKNGNTNKLNRHSCQKKKANPLTSQDKEMLKMSSAKFVCVDVKAYSVVEGEGFKHLCGTIFAMGQKHSNLPVDDFIEALPSRNTVKDGVSKMSAESKKIIKNEIEKAKQWESVSIAIDNWTDDHNHNSYFGIIVLIAYEEHGKIINKKFTLNVDSMPEMVKTKQVISEHLYRVLAEYGLSKQEVIRIVTIISDRGANIKFCLKDEGLSHVFCFAHIINNIVGTMVKEEALKSLISYASELASYMKNGGLCTQLNTTLKTFSRTRWNGVYIMFDSILNNYAKIVEILAEKTEATRSYASSSSKTPLDYISSIDIGLMTTITKFLKNFHDITQSIEGHKNPTLHMVWPAYENIQQLLQTDIASFDSDNGHILEEIKTTGRNYMQSKLTDFKPTNAHRIAAILHPYLKKLPKINIHERREAYRILDQKLQEILPIEAQAPKRFARLPTFSASFLEDFCNTSNTISQSNQFHFIYFLILLYE